MNKTTVYFEDARTQTVDETCSHLVVIQSTGFASMENHGHPCSHCHWATGIKFPRFQKEMCSFLSNPLCFQIRKERTHLL